jgi:probable RNA-binding protein EIF1AD
MVQLKRHKLKTEDYPLPTPTQCIAKVLAPRGNNLFTVTLENTTEVIIALPLRFNNFYWIKTGSFVIIEQVDTKTKVWGDIMHVLLPEQVKYIKTKNLWPVSFSADVVEEVKEVLIGSDQDDDDLFVNTNCGSSSDESDDE